MKNVKMGCGDRYILIEQSQTAPKIHFDQTYDKFNLNNKTINKEIIFSHSVKCLYFALKNITNKAIHSNYTTGLPVLTGVQQNLCNLSEYGFGKKVGKKIMKRYLKNI